MAEPVVCTVTLDLDKHLMAFHGSDREGEPTVEPQTLEDLVLGEAARQIATAIDHEARRDLVAGARTAMAAMLAARVEETVAAWLARPMQRTDPYGKPLGEPTSFEAYMAEVVDKALTERVHDPDSRDRGYSGQQTPQRTRIEWAIEKAVKDGVAKAVKEAVATQQAEVVALVRAEAATVLTEALSRAVAGR